MPKPRKEDMGTITKQEFNAQLLSRLTPAKNNIDSLTQEIKNAKFGELEKLRERVEAEKLQVEGINNFLLQKHKLCGQHSDWQDREAYDALKEGVEWLERKLTEETLINSLKEEDIPGVTEVLESYKLEDHLKHYTKPAPLQAQHRIPTLISLDYSKNLQSTPANASLPESKKEFLQKISYDPTTAKYFDEFQKEPSKAIKRDFNFILDEAELELFKKNGFVVSERLGARSFAKIYYKTYNDHLPVFLSADSILHAWHYSFDKVLDFVEEEILTPLLMRILFALRRSAVVRAKETEKELFFELDFFLGVSMSYLCGAIVAGELGQGPKIAQTMKKIKDGNIEMLSIFGEEQEFDFSMLTVRGRYATTEKLTNYFKAMMWLAVVDFRVAGENSKLKELEFACALVDLMLHAQQIDSWLIFENFFSKLIGVSDSMNFVQLQQILDQAGINLSNLTEVDLINVQRAITKSDAGIQAIQSGIGYAGEGVPRTFTMLGQKFVFDSWALGQLVQEAKQEDGQGPRRIPSAVDIAYSVLLNPNVAPLLSKRMEDPNGLPFRDGINFSRNLLAVRTTTQNVSQSIWDSSIYFQWIHTLQALSTPQKEDENEIPEVFKTEAWGMREVNTQIGSWTQLRHDTLLYAKQFVCFGSRCLYPDGYIEPKVEFWKQFTKMVKSMAGAINILPRSKEDSWDLKYDSPDYKLAQVVEFYEEFTQIMEKITDIAEKQEKRIPLSFKAKGEETTEEDYQFKTMPDNWFLNSTMEETFGSGATRYAGWYPGLFIWDRKASGKANYTVSDVFTDLPDPIYGDKGCVLHEGVGRVNLMLVTVDSGSGPVCYAGPVYSHYEFTRGVTERLNDEEWAEMVKNNTLPPPSPFSSLFLVQGVKEKKPKDEDDY